ncbi:conjugal transfer protein TraG N-terminal domain-containing protein, partial [Shewanella sp. SG44-6]|uniref:conjugal transfer protein TraG N-terminal domain-containing protein n=1 Tax=Shewanella sp. SG44-6 TaxID=2760959 RepID=UPI00160141A6
MITIYSLGDIDFMIRMAEAAEMAFSDGGIGNSRLPGVALGLSLLIAMFKQILDNKQFHIKTVFLSMFLFMFLFMPKVPVVIESSRSGELSQPIVLPVGIAAGAWLSTGIGNGFSKGLMDSYQSTNGSLAQSSVGVSIEPLTALLKSRFAGFDSTIFMGEVPVNVQNYMDECVNRDIANAQTRAGNGTGSVDQQALNNSPFSWSLLKVETNGSWFVEMNEAGSVITMTCENAWSYLGAKIGPNSQFADDLQNSAMMLSSSSPTLLEDGLAIMRTSNTKAIDFYNQNMMKALFVKASANSDWLQESDIMAFSTQYAAMENRRISQASQTSFWLETAPALITWFESFIFLLAPLMPFLVSLGDKGVGMFMKWFMILIAVNVWPIIQVGVNLYNDYYINKLLCGSMDTQGQVGSGNCLINPKMAEWSIETWGGMDAAYTQLETFVSTAAMLQTMVPSLAMMIIYGSAHTMINATSQMQSGAKPDTAPLTPPPIKLTGNNTVSDSLGRSSTRVSDGWRENDEYGKSTTNDVSTFTGSQASNNASAAVQRDLSQLTEANSQAMNEGFKIFNSTAQNLDSGYSYTQAAEAGQSKGVTTSLMATRATAEETGESTNAVTGKAITDASRKSESEVQDMAEKFAGRVGMDLGEAGGQDNRAKGGNFGSGKMGNLYKQVADNFLKMVGVSGGLTHENSWSDVKKTLQDTAQGLEQKYSESESLGYAEKFSDAINKVDGSKVDQAISERNGRSETGGSRLSVDWSNASDKAATTSRMLNEARSRSNELSETQANASTTNSSSSVKVTDLITGRDKATEYLNANKYMEAAGTALDSMLQDRFGQEWSNFKGNDLPSALNQLTNGQAPESMSQFAQDSGKLLKLSTDKDYTSDVVNQAIKSVNGAALGNESRGVAAVFDSIRSEAGLGKGANAIAAESVMTGTMLKDMSVNGNNRIGGVGTGLQVGEAFIENGLGLVLNNKPLTPSEDGQEIKRDMQTHQGKVNSALANGTDDTSARIQNRRDGYEGAMSAAENAVAAKPLSSERLQDAENKSAILKEDMNNRKEKLNDTKQVAFDAERKLNEEGKTKPISEMLLNDPNMHLQMAAAKLENTGVSSEVLEPGKQALLNRDVAPKEVNKIMGDLMQSNESVTFGSNNKDQALAMATMAASYVNSIDKMEGQLKADGKQLPQELSKERDTMQGVVSQFVNGSPADNQMRLSQLGLKQAIKDGNPEAALAFGNQINNDGKYSAPIKATDLLTSDKFGLSAYGNEAEVFSTAASKAHEYANHQNVLRGMESRPAASREDQQLLANLRKSFDDRSNFGSDLPAEARALPNGQQMDSTEAKVKLQELSSAAINSGLDDKFKNSDNLMKGLWGLSYGKDIDQVRGDLNKVATGFTSNTEQVAGYLNSNPNQIKPLLQSIENENLRSNVAEGLTNAGVKSEFIPKDVIFSAGNNSVNEGPANTQPEQNRTGTAPGQQVQASPQAQAGNAEQSAKTAEPTTELAKPEFANATANNGGTLAATAA